MGTSQEDDRKHASSLLRNSAEKEHDDRSSVACLPSDTDMGSIHPCTSRQMWILTTMDSQPEACVSQFIWSLPPGVKLDKLKVAWNDTLQANDILRTSLVRDQMDAFQVVMTESIQMHIYQESSPYLEVNFSEIAALQYPLVRAAVITPKDSATSSFALTIHRLLFDNNSLSELLLQIQARYEGLKLESNLISQAVATPAVNHAASMSFWEAQFEGICADVFPTTPKSTKLGPPTSRDSYCYAMETDYRPGTEFDLSTIIQLAWELVISHYTNSEEVLYGLGVSSQSNTGAESSIHPRVTTLPHRAQVEKHQQIRVALSNTMKQASAQRSHEYLSPYDIRNISEELSQAFEYTSNLTIFPATRTFLAHELFGKKISELNAVFPTCALDIDCTIAANNKSVMVSFYFNPEVLTQKEVQRLSCQLEHVLRQICQDMEQRILDVQVLSPSDARQLEVWNATEPESDCRCIHEMVVEQCRILGESVAVCSWDGELSYRELDEVSSKLAYFLIQNGVTSMTMVILPLERSKWMCVAILAVLRAGGICVPFDTSQPKGRIELILQDTDASVAITTQGYSEYLQKLKTVIILSDEIVAGLETQLVMELPNGKPSDAAFVFYTSGSTGRPKGVVMEHQNTATGLKYLNPNMNVREGSQVLHFASYAFDASMHEMLNALLSGGCLCIPAEAERSNLTGYIQRKKITWAILTVSTAACLSPFCLPSLETLVLTGERLTRMEVDKWAAHVTLINAFGPTETAFCCAVERIESRTWKPGSVGHMVNGVGWITKPGHPSQLSAIGSIGELLVEGPSLAREYLNDPDKTAASFITAPSWLRMYRGSHNIRLYRTGDLVKYNEDGSLQFIGRNDNQVKLRGQRVELGEIEYQVQRLLGSGINAVAEIIQPNGHFKWVLAVFLAFEKESDRTLDATQDLRLLALRIEGRLGELLPAHMVPQAFIPIGSIPATMTGKTDRKQLREIGARFTVEQLARSCQDESRPPATQMELELQKLWSIVLKTDSSKIHAEDSFFKIGGDSIAVMHFVGEARRQGLSLTVADVFNSPRLCDLAQTVIKQEHYEDPTEEKIAPFTLLGPGVNHNDVLTRAATLCGLMPADIEDLYPCTPLQEATIAMTMKRPSANISQDILELKDCVDVGSFQEAWVQVLISTPILRTRIVHLPQHGFVQVITKQGPKWESIQGLQGYLKASNSMGLGTPLTRLGLVDDSGKWFFVWTKHHAMFDGWSIPLILKHVEDIYCGRYIIPLTSLHGFVRHIIQSKESARRYWHEQLYTSESEVVAFPALPSVGYEPKADSIIQHQVPTVHSPWKDITQATLIRAALAVVLSHYTNSDVVFGVTIAGREAPVPGIEVLAGPTINSVPLLVHMDEEMTVDAYVEGIQNQAVGMIPFQHIGLSEIRKINPLRSSYQTLLVIQPASSLEAEEYGGELYATKEQETDTRDIAWRNSFNPCAMMMECQLASDESAVYRLSFDSNVIEQEQAWRILYQMEHVRRQICASRIKRIRDIEFITGHDLEKIWSWNKSVPEAIQECLHDLIAEQARLHPQSPAVSAWDGDLTYAELDDRSTHLAQFLMEQGLERSMVIPLCFEKSVWMSITMLGVMKAGGISVAMDVTQPSDRLRSIMHQVQPTFVLSSTELSERVAAWADSKVISVGNDLLKIFHSNGSYRLPLPMKNALDNLYITFTSGSTGTPKGVIITHQNVVSSIHHQQWILDLGPGSRVFDFASYAFDVAWLNFFYALTSGACLCVPSDKVRKNDISKAMQQLAVTWACLTPSTARLIDSTIVTTLRTLVFAGEPIRAQDMQMWPARVRLKNFYGPSECITSTGLNIDVQRNQPANIGRGLGLNTWVVALSGDRLVPIGAIGELWLEGPHVGGGYLHDPQKTAFSFVQDPGWLLRGAPRIGHVGRRGRLYRTGDLVRYCSDGTLVYIGRKDDQVKIRGQRVQLAEVEHHARQLLHDCDDVQMAAEIIQPRDGTNPLLALFYSIANNRSQDEPENRALLQSYIQRIEKCLPRKLPIYMIPNIYIPLSRIPLTVTGKTDKRELREIGQSMTLEQLAAMQPTRGERHGPTTEGEYLLRKIWASVLGVAEDSIGRDDSFLKIGGDSLGAIRLVTAARLQGLCFSVTDVFLRPVLCDLAEIIKMQSPTEEVIPAFSLLPSGLDKNQARAQAGTECGVAESQIEDLFPCTPLQEGLLSISAKRPWEYVDRSVYILADHVDTTRFQEAWESTVRVAAPVLRTRIINLQSQRLMQAVVDEAIAWSVEQDLCLYLEQDAQKPMGLGTALTRFALVQEQVSGKRLFVWTKHHAVYDGWSVPLILKRVEDAYNGKLIPNIVPFQSFVRYVIESSKDAAQYWQNQFQESEAVLFPTLPSISYEPQADMVVEYHVSGLRWPHRDDITASSVVRAALAILIGRYTCSSNVVFGATVIGRNSPVLGIEHMAGPTIATVPLQMRIPSDASLLGFLQSVQRQAAEMMPFEQIGLRHIRRLGTTLSQMTQFQTLLVVQPASSDDTCGLFQTRALSASSDNSSDLHSFNSYAMMVVCHLESEGVKLSISFDSAVVDAKQARRLSRQLGHVLHQICRNSLIQVRDLSTVSQDDEQDIWTWNATVPPPEPDCVHDLISKMALQQPDAPAVCAWDGQFTYKELEDLSTRLAYHLVDQLLYQDGYTFIPLVFEKSIWTPVAMLAVMKAGGASIALDVSQPESRLLSIIQQLHPAIILTSVANKELAERLGAKTVVEVGKSALGKISTHPEATLPRVDPSSPLYTVFTSGSTGTPKGAIISHANFSSAIKHQQEQLEFGPNVRVLDFASYAFDAAWSNLLHTLASGGCLCIPSESERRSDLSSTITRMGVTYADLTPSTSRLLDPAMVTKTLRTLILAGEPITSGDISKWASKLTLKNTYGPAECSVTATGTETLCERAPDGNIGRGIGFATWVVDPYWETNLAPIGAVGELWLEGPMVGQGYFGDRQKTEASFVEDPSWLLHGCARHPGRRGRLYRTGDLVKYNSDGALVFVGRKDHQVKLHGQRLELGDVENHVQQILPRVCSVLAEVVVPSTDKSSPMLVAFVSWNTNSSRPSSSHLQSEDDNIIATPCPSFWRWVDVAEAKLAETLPQYMVPAAFIPLRHIPVLPSGKADRRGLRNLMASIPRKTILSYGQRAVVKRQPTTNMEHVLQHIWAHVLNHDQSDIGTDDDFFRLGGDSISAMQLSSKCRAAGLSVTVSQIFQYKTLARLANHTRKVAINPVDFIEYLDTPFHLSPIQQMFFDLQQIGRDIFSQSFLLRVNRPISSHALHSAVEAVVVQHSMLRSRFSETSDGSWSQFITADVHSSYRYRHYSVGSWDQAISAINVTRTSLNIRSGPLFGVDLIETPRGQRLFVVAHHLVTDLVSWRIILEDLEDLVTNGKTVHLSSLPFQTWCHLQAEYSTAHLEPEVALPWDVPLPLLDYWGHNAARQNFYGDICQQSFTLTKHTSDLLLGSANNAFSTRPVEIFQAALLDSFVNTFLDRPAPVIFNEGHGRETWDDTIDISRTVGWFTSLWPTRISIDRHISLVETVMRTKDCQRQVPMNGWAYFSSRYLNPRGKQAFQGNWPVEILYNYEGVYQQLEREGALFRLEDDTDDSDGLFSTLRDLRRSSLIEVTTSTVLGCLEFRFHFNQHMSHLDLLLAWITRCQKSLEDLALQLVRLHPSHTLCDFPLLGLRSYSDLDQYLNKTLPAFGIPPNDIAEAYQCTPAQQLMLRAQSKRKDIYMTTFIGRIRVGETSDPNLVNKLIDSWKILITRHSALRTIFLPSIVRNGWDQLVLNNPPARTVTIQCSPTDAIATLATQTLIDGQGHELPHQLILCSTPMKEEMYFRLDMSHAISDAVSLSTILHEWRLLSMDSQLGEIPPPYSSYATYLLSTCDIATKYWLDYLRSVPPCLFPVTSTPEHEMGSLKTLLICSQKNSPYRVFCQEHGLTIPTLLKTVWAFILLRFADQTAICFGYFDSGRHAPVGGIQNMVGAVVNIMICHIPIDITARLSDILLAIQDDYQRSISHQFGSLRALDDLSLTPPSQRIFNTLVNYRREQQPTYVEEANINFEFISGEDRMEFHAVLNIDDADGELAVSLDYWDGKISDTVALQVSSLFRTVLSQVTSDLSQQVCTIQQLHD